MEGYRCCTLSQDRRTGRCKPVREKSARHAAVALKRHVRQIGDHPVLFDDERHDRRPGQGDAMKPQLPNQGPVGPIERANRQEAILKPTVGETVAR